MKHHFTIILLFASLSALAQYPITQASKYYFTHDEITRLYEEAALEVFEEYRLPASFFRNKYPFIREKMMDASRQDIVQAFKWVETTSGNTLKAKKGSEEYEKTKALYIKYFKKRVAGAFDSNKELRKLLTFSKSDRITFFESHVTVRPNGVLLVREDITIYNGDGGNEGYGNDVEGAGGNNNEIKRGIIRNFPTKYVDRYYLNNHTGFKLLSVMVNDKKATYQEAWEKNGVFIRIGDPSYELENGTYTYTIEYETKYQIKHLDSLDELAWNVTGNGWGFRIDSAACTIQLPKGAVTNFTNCFTGPQDAKASNCSFEAKGTDSISIRFRTSRPLLPYEGLTVATGWQKGIVAAPGRLEKAKKMFIENQLVFLYPLLALLLILYNSYVWGRVGKDPRQGNIIPTFYPPKDLSPAAMGYIFKQKFENRLVSAAMVDLAVRNKLVIDVGKEGILFKSNVYHIRKSDRKELPVSYNDYGYLGKMLIGHTIKSGEYNSILASLKRNMESDCKNKYRGDKKKAGFFALNNAYMAPGNLLTVLMFLYLVFGVFGVAAVSKYNPWQFFYMLGGLVLCIIVQRFFYRIMPAYTQAGRKVLDEIEGFRMYLKAADEQRINAMNPPEKSLELYERYMPFAIALDCENEWGNQFREIIAKATVDGSTSGSYSSNLHGSGFHSTGFSSSFVSSFSGSISSASTPPSSSGSGGSSFSSGGGSSGGGGGGGGGGGW